MEQLLILSAWCCFLLLVSNVLFLSVVVAVKSRESDLLRKVDRFAKSNAELVETIGDIRLIVFSDRDEIDLHEALLNKFLDKGTTK